MQELTSFIDLYRLELTLAVGAVATIALFIVAWMLRTPKKGTARGNGTVADTRRRKTSKRDQRAGSYESSSIDDDGDDEFREFNIFGKEKGGPAVFKDWD